MDDFIGRQFTTQDGGILTAVGHNGLKGSEKKYIFECSICSKDKELWPYGSIQIRKGSILQGKFSCGCGRNTYYTEEQQIIRCKRVCEDLGYIFVGLDGEYKSAKKTYVNTINLLTGNPVRCSIANLVRGVIGDRKHADEQNKVRNKGKRLKRLEEISEIFKEVAELRLISDEGDIIYKCLKCKDDIYSQNNLCTGEFNTSLRQVEKGFVPCRCNKRGFLTLPQRRLKVSIICKEENLKLIDIWDEDDETHMIYLCTKGNTKTTNYHNFIAGSRCHCCAGYGFDETKRGYFYLVKWTCKGFIYLKYGITNKPVTERLNRQKSKTEGGEYKIIKVWDFELGYNAEDLEDLIDYYFKFEKGVDKEVMPDGFTETLLYSDSNVNFIINKADWYKKKKEP